MECFFLASFTATSLLICRKLLISYVDFILCCFAESAFLDLRLFWSLGLLTENRVTVSSCSTFIPLFPSLIPVLSKTLDTTLKSVDRVGTLSYYRVWRSPYCVGCRFVVSSLHDVEVCPCWFSVLCHEKMLNFVNIFLHLLRWAYDFCLLILFMCCISCWFVWIEPPLHCCYEVSMVMVYDLINTLKFVLQAFYWQVFYLVYWSVVLFYVLIQAWLKINK